MKRVACPHCGFQNFEISAYCGRCERPLPVQRKEKPRETPPPLPRDKKTKAPPTSEAGRLTVPPPTPPREDLSPMPIETTELMRAQEEEVYRRAEVRAATENLPEAADAAPELDAIDAIEAAGALSPDDDAGEIEVPVELAAGWQIALAFAVDLVVILAAGVVVAWLETLVFSTSWHTRNVFLIDVVADWVNAHQDAALHGLVAAFVFGVAYHLKAGRRGGRTLGRWLTGTVLVRRSGRALSWPILITRLVLSLVALVTFGAGFFWAVIDRQHRTWHDLVSGTVVVRRRVRLRS